MEWVISRELYKLDKDFFLQFLQNQENGTSSHRMQKIKIKYYSLTYGHRLVLNDACSSRNQKLSGTMLFRYLVLLTSHHGLRQHPSLGDL